MIPTGDFQRFQSDILSHYSDYDEITFGILIVDPRQNDTREYIYNYLSVFHDESNKLFDFFIPGYEEIIYRGAPYNLDVVHRTTSGISFNDHTYEIIANNIGFKFNQLLFNEFCNNLRDCFNIQYTFNPMLILMSMEGCNIQTAKYIVIELDDNEYHSVRRSGMFFIDLFNAIHSNTNLQSIRTHMQNTYIRGNILNQIIASLNVSWLETIANVGRELSRFRIRTRME